MFGKCFIFIEVEVGDAYIRQIVTGCFVKGIFIWELVNTVRIE